MLDEVHRNFTDLSAHEQRQVLAEMQKKEQLNSRKIQAFLRKYPVGSEVYIYRGGYDGVNVYNFGVTMGGKQVYNPKNPTKYVGVNDVNGIKGKMEVWEIGLVRGRGRGPKK